MILLGSRALALRAPHLIKRDCVDFDFVCTMDEFNSWMDTTSHKVNPTKTYELPEFNKMIVEGSTNCEFEIITPGKSSESLANLVYNDPNSIETSFGFVPSLDTLFTIKDSHKYKKFNDSPRGFYKTAIDWHIMKSAGAEVKPELLEFSKLRQAETYTYKHPKLNVSKDEFFKDDGIKYVVEHDDIHESVKSYDRPAYTYYLKDNEPVLCDKNKFFAIDERIRLAGVAEESYVLFCERSRIAYPNQWSPDYGFKFALAKVCTSICSGFFRKYAFEHVFDVLKMYDPKVVEKFDNDLKTGKIRRLDGNKN